MTMKLFKKSTTLLLSIMFIFFSGLSSGVALAGIDVNSGHKHFKRTTLKCYIQLLGGKETIYVISAFDPNPENLANTLMGRTLKLPNTSQPLVVYKVHECLKQGKSFKSNNANRLEKSLDR